MSLPHPASGSAVASGPTAARAAQVAEELAAHEPHLVPLLSQELPRAMHIVTRRVVAAALREHLVEASDGTVRLPTPRGGTLRLAVRRHGFDRLEPATATLADYDDAPDPAQALDALTGTEVAPVRAELVDACVNLALALARRSTVEPELLALARTRAAGDMVELTAGMDPDEQTVAFERLATEGHPLHPCARTRLGWNVDDVLAHDVESPVTSVGFLAVRRDLHLGDEVGSDLVGAVDVADPLATAGLDPGEYAVTPVHPWQRQHVLRRRYADLASGAALVPLDLELPALVTSSLRTLLVPSAGRYVKLSLDIQVTSTRRTISVASTRNGPVLSRLLPDLIADDRVLLMAETGGSAVVVPGSPIRDRDLSAIVRSGLAGRLQPGEVVVPGSALPATDPIAGRTVVATLADRFARTRGLRTPPDAALRFVREYADLLLPPVLRLATRYGIALEAHLQNCLPTFLDGVPHRLAVRDLAGMRVHTLRLAESLPGPSLPRLWPGSVTVTDDPDVLRAKVAYTVLQAHLGEVILRLVDSHGLDESRAWAVIRSTVDGVYDELAGEAGLATRAVADHAFLTAPTIAHKALLAMRLRAALGEPGDHYVAVANALRGSS
ncbi:MAG TPA: IucA/IucC family protein [Micromonosporaceae bacterium]|jgi:siderophore synthetase component